jgi:hypothetical protein
MALPLTCCRSLTLFWPAPSAMNFETLPRTIDPLGFVYNKGHAQEKGVLLLRHQHFDAKYVELHTPTTR